MNSILLIICWKLAIVDLLRVIYIKFFSETLEDVLSSKTLLICYQILQFSNIEIVIYNLKF